MTKQQPIAASEVLAPVAAVAAFVFTYEALGTAKYMVDHIGGRNTLFGLGLSKLKELMP